MTKHDGKSGIVEQCDRSDLGSDARATESPPSTVTKTDKAAGRKSQSRALRGKVRKGKRTEHRLDEPVMIELCGNERIPATVLNESSSGMAILVVGNTLFRVGQRVAVRRNGVRTVAVVRSVQSKAGTCRVGLQLQPA